MSGRGGAGQGLQTIGALAAAAAITAGSAGTLSPVAAVIVGTAGIGTAAAGTKISNDAASQAQKKLQNSLLQPISTPKVAPTPDNEAVQRQRSDTLLALQNRSGRASTLLTNQNTFGG